MCTDGGLTSVVDVDAAEPCLKQLVQAEFHTPTSLEFPVNHDTLWFLGSNWAGQVLFFNDPQSTRPNQ